MKIAEFAEFSLERWNTHEEDKLLIRFASDHPLTAMNQFTRFRPNSNQLEDRTTPAALFTVTNFTDTAAVESLTLREAITQANQLANVGGTDTINFAPPALIDGAPAPDGGEIVLFSALPSITEGVNISGAASGYVQFKIRRSVNSDPFRILTIDMPPSPVVQRINLLNLHLSGGVAQGTADAGNGGGVWSNGATLFFTDVTVSGNTANGDGGGVWAIGMGNRGEVFTVKYTVIDGNTAANGGGVAIMNIRFKVGTEAVISNNTASISGGGRVEFRETTDDPIYTLGEIYLTEHKLSARDYLQKNGRITGDYSGEGKIKDTGLAFFSLNDLGITCKLDPDKNIIVESIKPGSPADVGKLKVGDKLQLVNTRPVKELKKVEELFRYAMMDGPRAKVAVARGKENLDFEILFT